MKSVRALIIMGYSIIYTILVFYITQSIKADFSLFTFLAGGFGVYSIVRLDWSLD